MENKKKVTLHVTVTIKETGQTVLDADGDLLLGALRVGEGQTTAIVAGNGSPWNTFETMMALKNVENRMYKLHPKLEHSLKLAELIGLNKSGTQTEIDLSEMLRKEFR